MTRKALALLCYLAVEAAPVSRDRVIALLWPDSDSKRGRTVLRTTLAHLRDGLGESVSAPTFLDITGDTLALHRQTSLLMNVDVDVDVVNRAASLARPLQSAELRAQLEQAVAAYRGDFLEGFTLTDAPEFDDWASVQREKWHQRMSRVLDQLSQLAFDSGEFGRGLDTAQRWVAHDPLNEVAHRRLMQLHLAAGNRSGALAAYDACQAILQRELNAEPAGETQALATRARTQTLPTASDESPLLARVLLSTTPLIGRAAEHQALITAYRAARLGQPQGALLIGEPGIGKTRLAHEFAGWAAAQGAHILRGGAVDTRTHLPYQLWIDAMRHQLDAARGRAEERAQERAQAREPFHALELVWRTELARLLPEIELDLPRFGAPHSGSTEATSADARPHLFEAIFRATLALAESRPLVVVFDDLQWADMASLDALLYVSHRWLETQQPVLLLATLREADVSTIQKHLAALKRQLPHTTVPLRPLSHLATQQLIQSLLQSLSTQSPATPATSVSKSNEPTQQPATTSTPFGDRLFDETAGHPLYLIETLKALHEVDLSQRPATPDVNAETLRRWQRALNNWVAPGVVEVIQARLQHLTPAESNLLSALSVLGQGSPFDPCMRIAGLGLDDALISLEICRTRGLIREAGNGELSFSHDKIREVVYAGLGVARRRSLHQRAAVQLEQSLAGTASRAQDPLVPRIAWHFDAAGDARAFGYLHQAGQAAMRIFAYEDAVQHFDRAIGWLQSPHHQVEIAKINPVAEAVLPVDEADAVLKQRIIDVYTGKASAHTQQADYSSAILACEALVQLARRWNDQALIVRLLAWQASQLALPGLSGDFDRAETLVHEVLDLARTLNQPYEQANAWLSLARVSCWRADFAASIQQSHTALDLLARHPSPLLQAYALNDLASTYLFTHDFENAQQVRQTALPLWRQTDRPNMLVNNLCIGMRTAIRMGRFDDAVALYAEAKPICAHMRDPWAHLNSLTNVGLAFVECGQVEEGIGQLEAALHDMADRPLPVLRALASTDLARICIALRTPARALPWVLSALELTTRQLPTWQGVLLPVLAQLAVSHGDLDRAQAWVRESAMFLARSPTVPMAHLQFDAARADLDLALGQPSLALQHQQRHIEACRTQGLRQFLPLALHQHAHILNALGQRDEAAESLREARMEAEVQGAQWSLRQILEPHRAA